MPEGEFPDSDFASAYAATHGRPPSGSEIKAAFPECPKSTAYDSASRASAQALLGNGARSCRVVHCLAVNLAP